MNSPSISEENLELARLYTKIGAWHRDVFEASWRRAQRGSGDSCSAGEWHVCCFVGVGGRRFSSLDPWLLAFVFFRFLADQLLVSPGFCGSSLRGIRLEWRSWFCGF